MGNHRVLVIGESCLDIFTYVSAERLAPDLPIPILNIIEETTNPGMAGNVARNLEALGLEVTLETNPNWSTVIKNRFMDRRTNHAFVRIDKNDAIMPTGELPNLSFFDAVVVSDYDKGFLSSELIEKICSSHSLVFLDTKKVLDTFAEKAALIKLNEFEFRKSEANLTEALRGRLIVTLGNKGAEYQGEHFPVEPIQVGDSSGAGDAFLASLVNSILHGSPVTDAIVAANKTARAIVGERGVTVTHV